MTKLYYYRKAIYFHRESNRVEESSEELLVTHSGSVITYEASDNERGNISNNDLNVPKCHMESHYISAWIYGDSKDAKNDLNYFIMTKLDNTIKSHYDEIKKYKEAKKDV